MARLGQILTAALALAIVTAAPAAAAMLQRGTPFPAWELISQSGQTVSSARYAGKTYLIWFYPRARTPG